MTDTGPIPPDPSTPSSIPPADVPPAATNPPVVSAGTSTNIYAGPTPSADDKTFAMLAHLLGIITFAIGPLIIWLMKKDQSPFVNDQGKEALNFQLTMLIGWVVSGFTIWFCIGGLIGLAVAIVNLIFCIMAGLKAKDGIAYRYPFNNRFIS